MNETTVNRVCANAKKCAGCQLNNLTYAEQLRLKQSRVNKLFYGIAAPEKITPSPQFLRYRNKATAVFFENQQKEIRWGIYQSAAGGICVCEQCFLQPKIADRVFNSLALLMKSFKIRPYDRQKKTGFLRSAMVRVSTDGAQTMLVLVTTAGEFPKARSFVNALTGRHPELTTIVQSVYEGDAVVMTGERENVLYGDGRITDELLGKSFTVSPHAFYQVNAPQTQRLYQKALALAALKKTDTFLDAYCGVGTIGLLAAEHAGHGVGAEINAAAVADARENARLNGCDTMEFFCGDAGDVLCRHPQAFDIVFTDPPRAGCSKKFLNALLTAQPERIVYISCNPETQVRDLRFLMKHGYAVRCAAPFDLFPQTGHVECVVLLTKVHHGI